MYSQTKMNVSTENYSHDIQRAAEAISGAERVVVGIGSGMTSAGGLDYADAALAERLYPEYYALGKMTIADIMGGFWPTAISESNAAAFWGFWARHIFHIRYEPGALSPYRDLYSLIKDRDHFICSTNVDGQLEKAGFERDRIFAPQGDYSLVQCRRPCSQQVYENEAMVDAMMANMVSPFEVREEDVPRCPRCGDLLVPNLRCDSRFVEKPHLENAENYEGFLNGSFDRKLVLLELGVGYNTPAIIRYPFERIAASFPRATLLRVNNAAVGVPQAIENKTIAIESDLLGVMKDVLSALH